MDDANPRSPLRTVQVLHELASAGQAVPLGVLAARLELPKTSLFRLLRALEAGGHVESDNGLHRVGPQALKLGAALLRNRKFPDCARPALQWVAAQSNETVLLGTCDESQTQIVYVDVIEPSNPLRFSIRPGLTRPLYSLASGQMLLAYRSSAERAAYLSATQFEKLASNTVAGAAALKRRIKDIRAQGFSVSVDGMFEGVYSIAAPVFDSEGHARAAAPGRVCGPVEEGGRSGVAADGLHRPIPAELKVAHPMPRRRPAWWARSPHRRYGDSS